MWEVILAVMAGLSAMALMLTLVVVHDTHRKVNAILHKMEAKE